MKLCSHCKKEILNEAQKCRYCGKWQKQENITDIFDRIRSSSQIRLGGGLGKSMGIFIAANVGVMIVLMIIVRIFDPHAGIGTAIFLLLIGCAVPFVMLFFSKPLLKWQYKIRIITAEQAENDQEKYLLELVRTLANRANLPAVPEVGIYESEE